MATIVPIDPVTRIEGHLKVELEVEGGEVVDAKCSGTMFRGFELIMKGKDPRDAQHLTQRICGVCPVSHAQAASLNLESAFGVNPPDNGRIVRNLVQGGNFVMSHILHFYHLAALDYVKGPDIAPFYPRYDGDYLLPDKVNSAAVNHYVQALEVRRSCHEMEAIFCGKMPHQMTFVPGGVTAQVTADKIVAYLWHLKEIQSFVDNVYIPDVLAVADVYKDYYHIGAGHRNFLSFGVFPVDDTGGKLLKSGTHIGGVDAALDASKITEQVKYSWYEDATTGKNPTAGETVPQVNKADAHSFIKAPRYNSYPCEVGPLARMWVNRDYREGKGVSVMDRHAARALECKKVADALATWAVQLTPGEAAYRYIEPPDTGEGAGLTEAPRGSVGHWIKIVDGKTDRYQIIPPTNWNCSPRDDNDVRGPMEEALIGTPVNDVNNPIEPARVIRSFDP